MHPLRLWPRHFHTRSHSVSWFDFGPMRAVRFLAIAFVFASVAVYAEPPADASGQTAQAQHGEVKELWVAPELANASKPGFIAQLQKDAAAGNANAQADLGLCYQGGHGVARDLATAAHWYELAAKAGHAGAELNLAQFYDLGAGVTQDHRKAYDLFVSAANQGQDEAQFRVGLHHAFGVGVTQDWTQARSWFEKAADQGNLSAMNSLADIYLRGHGVAVNYKAARTYLQKPAEAGNVAAQFNLAATYLAEQNYVAAAPWLKRSAEAGNPDAQFYWAVCLNYGQGVSRDPGQALGWARKAVQNLPPANAKMVSQAHGMLARILLGQPGANNGAEAYREASIAAQSGNPEGEYALAACFATGTGVKKDMTTAVKWYSAAAQHHEPMAAGVLGALYEKGDGVPKDLTEAVKWDKVGAQGGDSIAQFNLGRCYRDGLGVKVDADEALKWLRMAARGAPDNHEIAGALAQLQGQTHQVDPDTAFKQGLALAQAARRDGGSMEEAVKALTAAANQGHVPATIILSGWYRRGDHVPKDEERADALIAKVDGDTSPATLFQIGLSYMPGASQMPVEKNIDHALGYLQRAAAQGYGAAPGPLGFCYMTASAAHQDFVEAFKWLTVAAGQGDQNAGMYLERLRPRLTNAQTQEAITRVNAIRARSQPSAPIGPGNSAPRPWTE